MMYMIHHGEISPVEIIAHRVTTETCLAGKQWRAELILDNSEVFELGIFSRRQDAAYAVQAERSLYGVTIKKIRPKKKTCEIYLAVVPRIAKMRAAGLTSREIAMILQVKGVKTHQGGPWSPDLVRSLLLRRRNED